ncbi:hypothetical protein RhiirB3_444657 [Rhizophagus irregularis]|nr:hypothetical protein RhiirB3_444657 [Rhizophagus irregularis]
MLNNSQESVDSLINKAKKYSTKHKEFQVLYGISQNSVTGNYILVQNNCIQISGNKIINDFIQERQLKIESNDDIVFEWIPYNQFNEVKKTGKNGLITVRRVLIVFSSKLKESTYIEYNMEGWSIVLSVIPTNLEAFIVLHGISQNPDTAGDYIFEIGKGGFATVHSANWKNSTLEYNADKKICKRNPNRLIALKRLHISNKFYEA